MSSSSCHLSLNIQTMQPLHNVLRPVCTFTGLLASVLSACAATAAFSDYSCQVSRMVWCTLSCKHGEPTNIQFLQSEMHSPGRCSMVRSSEMFGCTLLGEDRCTRVCTPPLEIFFPLRCGERVSKRVSLSLFSQSMHHQYYIYSNVTVAIHCSTKTVWCSSNITRHFLSNLKIFSGFFLKPHLSHQMTA